MNSKERVLKAVAHLPTDRVPVDYYSRSDVTNKLISYLNLNSEEELYTRLGIDFRKIPINMHDPIFEKKATGMLKDSSASYDRKYVIYNDGRFEDEWGIVLCPGANKVYNRWISGPFVTTKDIDSFTWPDLNSFDSVQTLCSRVLAYQNRFALMGEIDLPFKICWHMRGFENYLCDMTLDPIFAKNLLKRIAIYQKEKGMRFIRSGIDIVGIYGDVGMQDRLLINPNTWRKIEKPVLAEMIKAFKKENPNILIFFHSDGNITELIPDMIEIGVDIINPIQPECMDLVEIKRKYGDQITMHGTISLQKTLPKGSVEDVKREVYERIKTCGKNGGLIICPSNRFQNDIPLENIVAMYDAVLHYNP